MIKEYFPCDIEQDSNEFVSIEDIKNIFEKIEDDGSRYIFENRLMYSLTGDYGYIRKIVLYTETGRRLNRLLKGKLYIYGAGKRGKSLVEIFCDKQWKGFIDTNREGICEGYRICRLHDFVYKAGTGVVISNKNGYDEIKEMLIREKGVPADRIIIFEQFYQQVRQNRYFEPKYLKNYSMQNQIFMDLGCYDGMDAMRAIDFFNKEKLTIYALEPDSENYSNCVNALKTYNNIVLMNRGIGENREKKYFVKGGIGARFSNEGDVLTEVDTIDHIAGEDQIGFIKMDIEGYEEQALLGGIKTIKRCRPVLAICIYHKRTDIWKLPLTILKLNSGYRFFLGHYTMEWGDTVLYAVDFSVLR